MIDDPERGDSWYRNAARDFGNDPHGTIRNVASASVDKGREKFEKARLALDEKKEKVQEKLVSHPATAIPLGLGKLGVSGVKKGAGLVGAGIGGGLGLTKRLGQGGIGGVRSARNKIRSSGENFLDWLLFLLALLAYALQLSYRTNSEMFFWIYAGLAFAIWIFRDMVGGPRGLRTFGKLLLYLLVAALYGFAGYLFNYIPYEIMKVIGVFFYFFPLYPTYIAWTSGEGTLLRRSIWVWTCIIFLLIVAALVTNYSDLISGMYDNTSSLTGMAEGAETGKTWFLLLMEKLKTDILNLDALMDPRVKEVRNPEYDPDQQESGDDLGVFIDNFEPGKWSFYWDEELFIIGDIRTASLLDTPTNINVVCNASYIDSFSTNRRDEIRAFEGYVDNDEMIVQTISTEPFACHFPLSAGEMFMQSRELLEELERYYDSNPDPDWNDNSDPRNAYNNLDIMAVANFTFSTWGAIEYLLMDREQVYNFQRLQKDLMQEYNLYENAEFRYTRGPVSLGARNMINPIAVESNITEFPYELLTFGATIGNNWYTKGRIKSVNNVILHIPGSLRIDNDGLNNKFCRFREFTPPAWDMRHINSQYRYYEMDKDYLRQIRWKDSRDSLTLLCPIIIENIEDYHSALGIGGVSYNTFVVEVDYEYELWEETSVDIEFDSAIHG